MTIIEEVDLMSKGVFKAPAILKALCGGHISAY